MLLDLIKILIGFVVLIYGANFLVNGSSGLAKRFKVSDLIIGLTVVAFGTSAPELVVNLMAAVNPATTDIALTNIIGSNMINTFVILGLAATIFPIFSQKSSRRVDIPLSILAPATVMIMAINGVIDLSDGLILLVIFIGFMWMNISKSLKNPEEQAEHFVPMKIWKALLFVLGGLGALILGAQLIVPSASNIASSMGISQSVIGLTIVALGTSLPELATSAVAAYKKNSDIALGNVIGSNIFNVFFILGTSSLISPLPIYEGIFSDLIITTLSGLLVFGFIYTNKERILKRWAGISLLITYIAYLIWKISSL